MATKKEAALLVFVPAAGISHLVSTVEFAKFLVSRDHRLSVALMVIKSQFDNKAAQYTDSLASSDRIRLINLPEGPTPDFSGSNRGSFMTDLVEAQKPHVKQAVSDLTRSESAPPLAAFVVDMFCTAMSDVARDFGVPSLVYFTSGVAFLGLMLHIHTLRERDNLDATELDATDAELTIPSFENPVPARVLPNFVLRKESESLFVSFATGIKQADGIIVNSFEELESYAVHSFFEGALPIYPVGPILDLKGGGDGADYHGSESEIIKWLDDQPPSSVLFLCFGSKGSIGEDQVREIARAVEDSGARFLWSLRKPPPKGTVGVPSDYSLFELAQILPPGFLDRTSEIGRIIGWAPQTQVLAHQATGAFVSHCGWNSTLESIYFGVPIATWPLAAEQQTNAFLMVRELKIAAEVSLDYRVDFLGESKVVLSAEKIEKGIRNVLEKDGEINDKVREMSEKSRKTKNEGGCSYSHLERLIDYIMEQV